MTTSNLHPEEEGEWEVEEAELQRITPV